MDLLFELLDAFEPGCLEPDFGRTFLCSYAKSSAPMTSVRWTSYRLERDIRLHGTHFGQRFRRKYFDATFNFCLTYDGELVAVVGFEVEGDAMEIWQIQGVKGQQRWLSPVKWTLALVQYAVGWASAHGFREAYVASVDRNHWAATHAHLDRHQGKLLYDVTARRCGFRRGDDGYYRRRLAL